MDIVSSCIGGVNFFLGYRLISSMMAGFGTASLPSIGDVGLDSSFMKCINGGVNRDQGSVVRRGELSKQSLIGSQA